MLRRSWVMLGSTILTCMLGAGCQAAAIEEVVIVGSNPIKSGRERARAIYEEELRLWGSRGESQGAIIAQGDSWFDYRNVDILWQLDRRGFDVYSAAQQGSTLEDMAYLEDYEKSLNWAFEKANREQSRPKAILLSAGGNDILASALPILLNHRQGAAPGVNMEILTELLARLDEAYKKMLGLMTGYSCAHFGTSLIPVMLHGYDYPNPDGRKPGGFWAGIASVLGMRIPGPWLEPAFSVRGYDTEDADIEKNKRMLVEAVDRLNKRLRALEKEGNVNPVFYVDFRGQLGGQDVVDTSLWADEIHPNVKGFKSLTDVLVSEIEQAQTEIEQKVDVCE